MLRETVKNVSDGEMGSAAAKADHLKAAFLRAEPQTRAMKVVQVLGQKQGPTAAQQTGFETIEIRNIEEQMAARFQKAAASLQEVHRVDDVFQHIPKRDDVEMVCAEVNLLEDHRKNGAAAADTFDSLREKGLGRFEACDAPPCIEGRG